MLPWPSGRFSGCISGPPSGTTRLTVARPFGVSRTPTRASAGGSGITKDSPESPGRSTRSTVAPTAMCAGSMTPRSGRFCGLVRGTGTTGWGWSRENGNTETSSKPATSTSSTCDRRDGSRSAPRERSRVEWSTPSGRAGRSRRSTTMLRASTPVGCTRSSEGRSDFESADAETVIKSLLGPEDLEGPRRGLSAGPLCLSGRQPTAIHARLRVRATHSRWRRYRRRLGQVGRDTCRPRPAALGHGRRLLRLRGLREVRWTATRPVHRDQDR